MSSVARPNLTPLFMDHGFHDPLRQNYGGPSRRTHGVDRLNRGPITFNFPASHPTAPSTARSPRPLHFHLNPPSSNSGSLQHNQHHHHEVFSECDNGSLYIPLPLLSPGGSSELRTLLDGTQATGKSNQREEDSSVGNSQDTENRGTRGNFHDDHQHWDAVSSQDNSYAYCYEILCHPHTDTCPKDPVAIGSFEDFHQSNHSKPPALFWPGNEQADTDSLHTGNTPFCLTPQNRKRRVSEITEGVEGFGDSSWGGGQARSQVKIGGEGSNSEQQEGRPELDEEDEEDEEYYRLPQTPPQTSMDIFQKYVTRNASGQVDASGIIDKGCFEEWVTSRKKELKNPYLTFVQTIRGHVTGDPKVGRNPFRPKVEASLLQLLRRKQVWPCFEGTPAKYGSRGMKLAGFHETNVKSKTNSRSSPSSKQSVDNHEQMPLAATSDAGSHTPRALTYPSFAFPNDPKKPRFH